MPFGLFFGHIHGERFGSGQDAALIVDHGKRGKAKRRVSNKRARTARKANR